MVSYSENTENIPGDFRSTSFLVMRDPTYYKLSFLFFSHSAITGVIQPYWPQWLKSSGLSDSEVGILISVPLLLTALAGPMSFGISTRLGRPGIMLFVVSVMHTVAFLLLYRYVSFHKIFALTILAGISFGVMSHLRETTCLSAVRTRGLAYGHVRIWASISYMIASVAAGFLFDTFESISALEVIIVLCIVSIVASAAVVSSSGGSQIIDDGSAAANSSKKRVLLAILCASLVQSSHGLFYGFSTIYWLSIGHTPAVIGLYWAFAVICEIVVFAHGDRIAGKVGVHRLLMLAGIGAAIRWIIMGVWDQAPAIVVAQALHGVSFAGTHIAITRIIAMTGRIDTISKYQGIYQFSWAMFLAGVIVLSGVIYSAIGHSGFFIMSLLAVLPVAIWKFANHGSVHDG